MVLTYEEYFTMYILFDNAAEWRVHIAPRDERFVHKIRINEFTKMGELLYVLLQQNVLKEFLVEKTHFDKKHNIILKEPLSPDTIPQEKKAVFNWGNANLNNRTNIINWKDIVGFKSIKDIINSYPEVTERVKRGSLQ